MRQGALSQCAAETDVKKAPGKMRVTARLESLTGLTEFVTKRARACGMPEEVLSRIQLAVEEIFTNQVRHAYKGQGGDVEVECAETGAGTFCIRFTDWGPPFDPRVHPAPDTAAPLDEREPGGLGLHLVRNMAGGLDYCREGDRNVVTVCFDRQAGARKGG